MPHYEPAVPARYFGALIDYLRSAHPDRLDAILAASGLASLPPDAAQATLSLAQTDQLLRMAARVSGRSDIGFDLGLGISVGMHGALAPALQRCATLDQALRLVARYFCLITPSFFVRYRRDAHGGELVYRPSATVSTATLHDFFEIHAVSLCSQVSASMPQLQFECDVYLSMDAPPHAERYRQLQPVRFHFGPLPLPEVRFAFAPAQLDQALSFAPQAATREVDLSEYRDSMPRAQAWADWVELMLREADGCQPSMAELAELMNISERTLSRYLAREGVNFRQLALQVRYQRACELLRHRANSITQVAYRLGYGHPASFSNAFRAASGMSPDEYRVKAATGSAPGKRPA
ncbi:MAG: helix-turn-helix domain-containing protein [Pseudomonadota bacterium]